MANVRQLKDHGAPIFPITHVSLVKGMEYRALMDATYAWDGTGTPDVSKIPAGVVVTYNGTDYTGTLVASASTTGRFYLVPSTTVQGEWDRYMTDGTGSSYAWKAAGNTSIPSPAVVDNETTDDPTKPHSAAGGKRLKDQLGELEAKMYDIYQNQLFYLAGYWTADAEFSANNNYRATGFIPIINITEVYVEKLHLYTSQNVIQFYDKDGGFISGVAGLGPGDATPVTGTISVPSNAKYITFATILGKLPNAKISGFESVLMYSTKFKEDIDALKEFSDNGDARIYESDIFSKHGYIDVVGDYQANENYRCTDYLPLNGSISIKNLFQYDTFDVISYYSNSFTYISGVKGLGVSSSNPVTGTYTPPVNAAYVRFTTYSSRLSLAHLFIGSTLSIAESLLGKIVAPENSSGELTIKITNSGNTHYLYVFEPTGNSTKPYIGVLFRRIVNAERNTDVWCTDKLAYYDATFNEISGENIVLDGEWDGVIREKDGNGDPYPDFLGGYVHGNENMDSVSFKVDGKDISVATDAVLYGNNLTIICHSILNRYGEPSTNVIEKLKTIEVSKGKIKISNTFTALTNISIYQFFPVMLPINRAYSQYCARKNRSEVFDDSTSSHAVVYSHFANDTYLRQYNDNFIMETSIKASMRNNMDAADQQSNSDGVQFSYYISASANPAYNKIYYLLANKNSLSSGNIVNCEATFKYKGK